MADDPRVDHIVAALLSQYPGPTRAEAAERARHFLLMHAAVTKKANVELLKLLGCLVDGIKHLGLGLHDDAIEDARHAQQLLLGDFPDEGPPRNNVAEPAPFDAGTSAVNAFFHDIGIKNWMAIEQTDHRLPITTPKYKIMTERALTTAEQKAFNTFFRDFLKTKTIVIYFETIERLDII